MALDTIPTGGLSGVGADVDAERNLQVVTPGYNSAGEAVGGGDVNGPASFSEVDAGTKTGVREVLSCEVDKDYRARVAHDNLMDMEDFVDGAQNTGKFFHAFTTLTATESTAGLLTNSGAITTTTTGMTFGSNIFVPVGGTQTYVCETSLAFTAQPNANTVVDFGGFLRGAANPFLPLDGCFFRLTSAGLFGVISKAGVETATAVFPLSVGTGTFVYTNNANNRYLIQMNNVSTSFWINNFKYGEILAPSGGGFPCQTRSLSWSIRHAIVGGAAGATLQCLVTGYRVLIRGPQYGDSLGVVGNRVFGAYQGLSGGTMGSLANYANSANPTAAVPTNTTAALGTGLGGQFWETFTLALTTDGIICSFQNPAASATVQARRLKITGVNLMSYVQTVLAGGPQIRQYSLAWGHTAVSLATAESASFATGTTKAPRRMALPDLTQVITAAQAVSTMVSQPGGADVDFEQGPIYINPGEFVALVVKGVGTVGTAGVLGHMVKFDASWE